MPNTFHFDNGTAQGGPGDGDIGNFLNWAEGQVPASGDTGVFGAVTLTSGSFNGNFVTCTGTTFNGGIGASFQSTVTITSSGSTQFADSMNATIIDDGSGNFGAGSFLAVTFAGTWNNSSASVANLTAMNISAGIIIAATVTGTISAGTFTGTVAAAHITGGTFTGNTVNCNDILGGTFTGCTINQTGPNVSCGQSVSISGGSVVWSGVVWPLAVVTCGGAVVSGSTISISGIGGSSSSVICIIPTQSQILAAGGGNVTEADIHKYLNGFQYGASGTAHTGDVVLPSAANVLSTAPGFGSGGSTAGTASAGTPQSRSLSKGCFKS